MKHSILFEIINKLKSKPALMRKVKIFAVVGLFGFMFVGGMTIWAGISAYKYVVASVNQGLTSPTVQSQVQNMKTELKQIQFQPLSCWNKAQSLLAVQPWLERPALDNFHNLKLACLDSHSAICEGYECHQMKKIINTAQGETI
jgi:hypothetical protein